MNCDTMTGAPPSLRSAILGSPSARAARGRATTVTRDPTAIPHGSSTATSPAPPLASRSPGAETVAGQEEAGAAVEGDGEGEEEDGEA